MFNSQIADSYLLVGSDVKLTLDALVERKGINLVTYISATVHVLCTRCFLPLSYFSTRMFKKNLLRCVLPSEGNKWIFAGNSPQIGGFTVD